MNETLLVEVIWFTINGVAWTLTAVAIRDTRRARTKIRAMNGRAREIVANGNVKREVSRFIAQSVLLLLALPALFTGAQVSIFNYFVLGLITVSLTILANTVNDARDRRRLIDIVEEDIERDRQKLLKELQKTADDTNERVVDIQDTIASAPAPNGAREQREPRELREARETEKTITQPREPREPRPERPPLVSPEDA